MQSGQRQALQDIVKPLASGFLSSLINSFQHSEGKADSPAIKNDPARLLKQARIFIADNLTVPLQIGDVSRYLHISERQLSRLFHDYESQTFVQYTRGERVRRATDLLSQSNKSIKEIAAECGFESIHYFTRVFADAIGKPPGQYREENG
jgi:transcriptional regulator GlxA family with amidase domain